MSSRQFAATFILPDGLDLGGVTTWSIELANRLSQMGRETVLLQHRNRYHVQDHTLPDGVTLGKCLHPVKPNNWYLFKKDIEAFASAYAPHLPSVVIPNYSFGSYAACARLAKASPEKIRIIGMAHTDNPEYYRWLVQFETIIHAIVAVSDEIATHLKCLLPHRKEDIFTRPYGVHVRGGLERTYSPAEEPLQILYAGRLSERQKRVSDLVRLVDKLHELGVAFQLRLYGAGRDEQMLRDRIGQLPAGARSRIALMGQLPPAAMPEVYRKSDLHVLVSDYEGTSVSMLEAMAEGCIPVVTAVSGTASVIEEGANGFSVKVGDMDAMAAVIARLAEKRDSLAALGMAAHTYVKRACSYEEYVPWFAELLERVCQQTPRRWEENDSFAFHFPVRQFVKEASYVMAAKPGFRWLYGFKGQARKIIR